MKKETKSKLTLFLLILTVFFAIFTRFWKISILPFPPEGDEIAFGYYGWSLLNFGTDEYGNTLPSSFVSIGDYKYPGLAYLNIIPALLFGPSNLTVRFWSALSGILLVILIYKLTYFITNNKTVAVISSWLAATSPWSLIESRMGWENHVAMVMVLGGFYFLFKYTKKDNKPSGSYLFYLSLILFIFSIFTYAAERIFLPLILMSLFFLTYLKQSKLKSLRKKAIISFLLITTASILLTIPNTGRGRAGEDVWRGLSYEQIDHLEQTYVEAGISPVRVPARVTWFFHNKYTVSLLSFIERYTSHFSPEFLFFKGEAVKEAIPDMGVLLYIELLLLPTGFLYLLKNSKGDDNSKKLFFLSWLILAPIPSSLTQGSAHVNRASLMIPPIAMISGIGFYEIVNFFKGKAKTIAVVTLSLGIVVSSLYTLNQIFVQKPVNRPWYKEQVYEDVTTDVLKIKDKYDAIVTNDDDYVYYLFYGKISPSEFVKNSIITPLTDANKWERVESLYNIHFKMPFNCPRSGKINVLYVCSGNEIPQNSKLIKTYYYFDNIPAFTFIEFYPLSQMPTELPSLPENLHYMVETETNVNYPDGIIPSDYKSFW